jgi:hypothetical protein
MKGAASGLSELALFNKMKAGELFQTWCNIYIYMCICLFVCFFVSLFACVLFG